MIDDLRDRLTRRPQRKPGDSAWQRKPFSMEGNVAASGRMSMARGMVFTPGVPGLPPGASCLLHGKAQHPAELALAGLRPLVLTRPSGPGTRVTRSPGRKPGDTGCVTRVRRPCRAISQQVTSRYRGCCLSRSRISVRSSWSFVGTGSAAASAAFDFMIQPRNFTMKMNRARARIRKLTMSPRNLP